MPDQPQSEVEAMKAAVAKEFATLLPQMLAALDLPREKLLALQQERLRSLLAHAKANSAWHAEKLKHTDPASFTADRMGELPVMTKADFVENFDAISTDPKIKRSWFEEKLANGNFFPDGRHCLVATGGSTGKRVIQVLDARMTATIMLGAVRTLIRHAHRAGGQAHDGRVMSIYAAPGAGHLSDVLSLVSPDPAIPSASEWNMSVIDPFEDVIARLNRLQPSTVATYSSYLRRLIHAQETGLLDISPGTIGLSAETPSLFDLERAKELWGCNIRSVWGASEVGLLGEGSLFQEGHLLAEDIAVIETVDENNQPVPPGTECAKVLVTCLMNTEMPMIRYEIEDRLTVSPEPAVCGSGMLVGSYVIGRTSDNFTYPCGTEVNAHLFRHVLDQRPMIFEYQVRQTVNGAHVTLVTADNAEPHGVAAKLEEDLARIGIADPEVMLQVVLGIERTAAQKLRQFVPLKNMNARE